MPSLFGVDIAGIVATELGGGLLPVTLTEVTSGSYGSDLTEGPALTETTHSARGFIEDWSQQQLRAANIGETGIRVGDKKITVLGGTISPAAVPETGWKVTIEGKTYRVEQIVSRDPAAATYVLNGRL